MCLTLVKQAVEKFENYAHNVDMDTDCIWPQGLLIATNNLFTNSVIIKTFIMLNGI